MEDAEKWLLANDPYYKFESQFWKHLRRKGVYERPRQEVPWGLANDLQQLVETERAADERRGPKARGYVDWAERRACERCGETFIPKNSWSRFCSRRCQHADLMRRKRL
jgi:hypothetical protein